MRPTNASASPVAGTRPSVALVADPDAAWRREVSRALREQGFTVQTSDRVRVAMEEMGAVSHLVTELLFEDGTAFELLKAAERVTHEVRTVVASHHASTPAVVRLMKLGAHDVLAKPCSGPQVVAAFDGSLEHLADSMVSRPSLARARWEHIQRALAEAGGNISEAARSLGLHRQSLQRALRKHAP